MAALPKKIGASSSQELSEALEQHLEETKEQVSRLDSLPERKAVQPETTESKAMQALLGGGRLYHGVRKSRRPF